MKIIDMFIKNKNFKKVNNKNSIKAITKSNFVSKNKNIIILKEPKYKIVKEKQLKPTLKNKIQITTSKIKINIKEQGQISHLGKRWLDIMYHCGLGNKYKQTFTLINIKKCNYGFSCQIFIPDGYSVKSLEDNVEVIQNNLSCTFMLEKFKNKRYINAKFITIENCNNISFVPAKVRPYEAYFGVNEAGEPIIFNVNKEPQILIAGATRKGKNGCIDHAIPSWIYNCNENEVELYLFQFAKGDFIKYKKCKQTKCFVMGDMEKMCNILEYIIKEARHRNELLIPMLESFKGDNLYDYNKLHQNKQLPYIYIIIDEFMDIANTTEGDEKIKKKIISYLKSVAEWGGALGINYIILHQKPEKALMPTFLKNMSNVRICFGFKDEVCARIVLGEQSSNLAIGLPARKAYYVSNDSEGYLYTTNLRTPHDNSRILKYIKNSIDSKHKTIDEIMNFSNNNTKNNTKRKNTNNSKQDKEKEALKSKIEKLKNKMKNINETNTSNNKNIDNNSKQDSKNTKSSIIITKSIPKQEQQTFDNVDPTIINLKKEKFLINLKNIPNYVPYTPPNDGIEIIDETHIASQKSEKSNNKKKGVNKNDC